MSLKARPIWHVLGTGAVGSLMMHYLSKYADIEAISSRSLPSRCFIDIKGVSHNQTHFFSNQQQKIKLLFLCVKANQALEQVEKLKHRFDDDVEIVCLFNGYGPQQQLSKQYKTWAGSVTHGISTQKPGHTQHMAQGNIQLGPLFNETSSFQPQTIKEIELKKDILPVLQKKLLVNCLINPMTVIFDCLNGQLLEIVEAQQLMAKLDLELNKAVSHLKWAINETSIEMANKIAALTANNNSSMRQDIQQGRISEIDQINGYWQQISLPFNMPTNDLVIKKVKALQLC